MVFAELVARAAYHGTILSDDAPVTLVASAFLWSVLWAFTDPAVMPTVPFALWVRLGEGHNLLNSKRGSSTLSPSRKNWLYL